MPEQCAVVVMGVSATGKSTVARRLAEERGWVFLEGDDLHPQANIDKMSAGEPLDDEDRRPWLDRVGEAVAQQRAEGDAVVVTCSALRRAYRDRLRAAAGALFFLHLDATYEVLEPRMATREKHFMPTGLLRSQLDTLEPLAGDEHGVVVDVAPPLEKVVAASLAAAPGALSSPSRRSRAGSQPSARGAR